VRGTLSTPILTSLLSADLDVGIEEGEAAKAARETFVIILCIKMKFHILFNILQQVSASTSQSTHPSDKR
jgi:hypothetical protein